MKRNTRSQIAHAMIIWTAATAAVYGANRQLPPIYVPGEPFPVTIKLDVPGGTSAVGLDDTPPPGWTVDETSITEGGFWDNMNDKVKWGPFFVFPTEVTYMVTAPAEVLGEVCFAGTISLDGVNEDIGGESCLSSCTPESCNDENLCTTDVCEEGVCVNNPIECPDDGQWCNGEEVCDPGTGQCTSTAAPCEDAVCCEEAEECVEECCSTSECDDGDLCTIDDCVEGQCLNTQVECPDDGTFCNGTEVCSDATGQCISSGDPCSAIGVCCEAGQVCAVDCCADDDCDDGDACTEDVCSEGACSNDEIVCLPNGIFCDGSEACDPGSGECVSDGMPCPAGGVCCEESDSCEQECCADVDCVAPPCMISRCEEGICIIEDVPCIDDGNFCNGPEECNDTLGICIPSGNPCAPSESCCEDSDSCVTECCSVADCPVEPCQTRACTAGACIYEPVTCADDGVYCNGIEVCDPSTGQCASSDPPCPPDALCCEELNFCATECCSNAECEDTECLKAVCISGFCVQTPAPCDDDGLFCNGSEMCDTETGQCKSTGTPCDAEEMCCESSDICGECCQHADCNDGSNCTMDTCESGDCVYRPIECPDDGEFCNGPEVCSESTGLCESGPEPCGASESCCEDAEKCVTECCDSTDCPDGGCVMLTCVGGVCAGEPVECPDDGVFCNGVETCEGGACISIGNPCDLGEICCEDTGTCGDCCADADCASDDECAETWCDAGQCVSDSMRFDMDGDGLVTYGGDVLWLWNCYIEVAYNGLDALETCCPAGDCECRADCDGNGFAISDMRCWSECLFNGNCD